MPPTALRAQLRKLYEAIAAQDPDLAAARLAWLSAEDLARIGTLLDSSPQFDLRLWRLIPARTAAPGSLG